MHVRYPDLPVHLDPEFETFTYGHVRRGFGDIKSLLKLDEKGVLFFYATLQRQDSWSTYIIGYFGNPTIYDCRELAREEILNFKSRGFANNAHLKRINPSVDLLIKGGEDSRLLTRAYPMAEDDDNLTLRKPLRDIIRTASGKEVRPRTPWFRWTLMCDVVDELLMQVLLWQQQF